MSKSYVRQTECLRFSTEYVGNSVNAFGINAGGGKGAYMSSSSFSSVDASLVEGKRR